MAALLLSVGGMSAADPAPQDILRNARLNQSGQHRVLDGHLRHGPTIIPFRLTFDGDTVRYAFTNPPEELVLHLGDRSSRLDESTKGGTERIPASRLDGKVRGTDITFEDIALKFLYWPSVTLEGDQVILTRGCWKLLLQPGISKGSQYGSVRLWVDKQSGAFLQADAFDKAGKLAKRFKVIAPQRINGEWILKKMRIEQMGNPNDDTPTYLEIEGMEKSS